MSEHPVSVSILATEDTSLSTLFGLSDVLGSVGLAWEAFVSGSEGRPLFDVRVVGLRADRLRCADNVAVTPDATLDTVDHTDVAIVASFTLPASLSRPRPSRLFQRNLHKLDPRGPPGERRVTAAFPTFAAGPASMSVFGRIPD